MVTPMTNDGVPTTPALAAAALSRCHSASIRDDASRRMLFNSFARATLAA